MGSSKRRPIRRFTAKIVLSGLVTAWRLAGWPINRSPSLVNATTDGVVRAPSAFSITLGLPPSMTATQLLVVPKSIPMTLAIFYSLFLTAPFGPIKGSRVVEFSSGYRWRGPDDKDCSKRRLRKDRYHSW